MFSSSSNQPKGHGAGDSGTSKEGRQDQRKPITSVSKFPLAYDPSHRGTSELGLVSRNSGDKMEGGSPQHTGNDYPKVEGTNDFITPQDDTDPTPFHEKPRLRDDSRTNIPAKIGKVESAQGPKMAASKKEESESEEEFEQRKQNDRAKTTRSILVDQQAQVLKLDGKVDEELK